MLRAYYNEIDRFCCDWLSDLMDAGHIMPGRIDDRSIADVAPQDVAGFARVHFFAGIAGWEVALALAGWPQERPVWTGSCPCQPFSTAGKRQGNDDPRHLWPEFHRLVAERRPAIVFGEQVASPLGRAWLAAVRADLEGVGYAVGAADLPAAGVGAPHVRQRLWWVATQGLVDADRARFDEGAGLQAGARPARPLRPGEGGRLADTDGESEPGGDGRAGAEILAQGPARQPRGHRAHERLADADGGLLGEQDAGGRGARSREGPADESRQGRAPERLDHADRLRLDGRPRGPLEDDGTPGDAAPRPGPAQWADIAFVPCADGRARPFEPGIFPLADGVPGTVGRLRAYGNAIVPQVAAAFVEAVADCLAPDGSKPGS